MATMYFIVFLLLKNINAIPAFENESDPQCYYDYEKVFVCQFPSSHGNCSGYRMTLLNSNKSCNFKYEKNKSKCKCYVETARILHLERITVWQNDKLLTPEDININITIKPKAPKDVVVEPIGYGNFLVSWKTNYDDSPFSGRLTARVTWKNGEKTEEVTNIGSRHYEIRGDALESNTNYSVTVQNFYDESGLYSESSTECFFTTAGSTESLLKVVIILISTVVIVLLSALFWCYIRFKGKLWDKVPKPTIPRMGPGDKWVLLPSETLFSPIYTEPLQMDAIEVKPQTNPYATGGSGENLQQTIGMTNGPGSMGHGQLVFIARDDQAVSIGQMQKAAQVIDHVEEELSKVFPNLGSVCETNLNPAFSGDSAYYCKKHNVLSEENSHAQTSLGSVQLGNNLPLSVSPSLQTDFSYHVRNGESLNALLTREPSEPSTENESNVQASFDAKTLDSGYQNFGELVSKDLKEPNLKTDHVSIPDSHGATGIHQMNPSYLYHDA